jgi:hypothetical protein
LVMAKHRSAPAVAQALAQAAALTSKLTEWVKLAAADQNANVAAAAQVRLTIRCCY